MPTKNKNKYRAREEWSKEETKKLVELIFDHGTIDC